MLKDGNKSPNKALHWTGIPLRSIPASELWRYVLKLMKIVILMILLSTVLCHASFAVIIGTRVFKPCIAEQRIDSIPPTPPQLILDSIGRGMGTVLLSNGMEVDNSIAEYGSLNFSMIGAEDNRTSADSLGYRFCFVDGHLPINFNIPSEAYYAFSLETRSAISLKWNDERSWDQDPFDFRICVIAIDRAGNESVRSNIIEVKHNGHQEERYQRVKKRIEDTSAKIDSIFKEKIKH